MEILVTGGAGYIGSILIRLLLDRGYTVHCLDRLFFGTESIDSFLENHQFKLIKDDIRWFNPKVLDNVDIVVDLAALSNDPSGELDPSKTLDINYRGRKHVAELSKEHGIKKYIFASSCSVYGFSKNVMLNEEMTVNPLTTYGKANLMAERDILALADRNFTVTVLRKATAYGISPRMRFDLAINGMTLGLYKTGKIPVMRDGYQWRPFLHVKDISLVYITVLETSPEKVNGQIFNVGSNEQNYQILPLAKLIAETLDRDLDIEWYGDPDTRSYKVDFSKLKDILHFKAEYPPKDSVKEVYEALNNGKISDTLKTKTVEWYRYLLNAHDLVKQVSLRDRIL